MNEIQDVGKELLLAAHTPLITPITAFIAVTCLINITAALLFINGVFKNQELREQKNWRNTAIAMALVQPFTLFTLAAAFLNIANPGTTTAFEYNTEHYVAPVNTYLSQEGINPDDLSDEAKREIILGTVNPEGVTVKVNNSTYTIESTPDGIIIKK